MDTNYKMTRLFDALAVVREVTDEMRSLHNGGLTYREVDEVMFGSTPETRRDVSGRVMLANSVFSWLRRFGK